MTEIIDFREEANEIKRAWFQHLMKSIEDLFERVQKVEAMYKRVEDLEDTLVSIQAQLNAIEYLALPKEKVGRFVEDVQDKMYRISKDITEKLKPDKESDFIKD